MGESLLTLADVERAIAVRDAELGAILVRYLEQSDPDDGRPELSPHSWDADEDDPDEREVEVPSGAMTIDELRSRVSLRGMANKNPTEQKLTRREAFAAAEASPFSPPRLKLGKLLTALYAEGDPAGRAALLHVFAHGKMKWGVWQAAKQIYKLTETNHDVAMFGVLGFRFDAMSATEYERGEIGPGTLLYLRRRVWRYLRKLGKGSEAAYAGYCVELLRHYPESYGSYSPSWVAANIFQRQNLRGNRGAASFGLPSWGDPMAARAYPNAWKLSPAPLLRILDSAVNDIVCDWAIKCLRADHALALRAVEPAWLARLGRRPVVALHSFVVSLLRESPELHQSKLRGLGLHDVVLSFLRSGSSEAVKYALEYAASHAPDISVEDLVVLVEHAAHDVAKFAAARLESMSPQQLGLATLLRLLGRGAAPWAAAKLTQGFSPKDIDATTFVETSARDEDAFRALLEVYNDARVAVPAAHWIALLDDKRFDGNNWSTRSISQTALTELGKRSAREIGIPWIQASLENRSRTDAVVEWLDAGMLSGDDLDVEWLKMLVGKPRLRPIALRLLGDRRRVSPSKVGLSWLLELARSSDADLQTFAQRMLLESFEPGDFANGDVDAGVARLWDLATGKKSPETVRQFAATYLKAHHPELSPRMPEARSLGITPKLAADPLRKAAYSLSTIAPLFDDERVDVRRLAVAIAGEELLRWDNPDLVYELAGANKPEPRSLGGEWLLGVLVEGTTKRVPAAWLTGHPTQEGGRAGGPGSRLFQLAESSHKAAREVALTLIRRMYDQVGGAEKLAWLMDSPERDVRLFAVRLFWDRHRPKPWPADYTPRKHVNAAIGTERFADVAALRQFARVVLFGLPPGRVGERDPLIEGAPKPERALPASIAKRRLIEAMRDVALEDVELANAIGPIFVEFTSSTAKGEWQAALQALVALRAHHQDAFTVPVAVGKGGPAKDDRRTQSKKDGVA